MSTENKHEIMPCPFCGNEDPFLHRVVGLGMPYWRVICFGCGAKSQSMMTKIQTVSLWNRRNNNGI